MKKDGSILKNLSKRQLQQIKRLCPRYRVANLYLFGSVLTDEFRPDSDVDLLVNFQEMDLLAFADNYFELLENLEKILDRPVDLVIEPDLSNPVLIETIHQARQLIYDKEDTEVVA